jgi:hypothetical protein
VDRVDARAGRRELIERPAAHEKGRADGGIGGRYVHLQAQRSVRNKTLRPRRSRDRVADEDGQRNHRKRSSTGGNHVSILEGS